MPSNIKRISLLIVFFALFSLALCYAENDGFGSARKMESEHFTVYAATGTDADLLAQSLNPGISDTFITKPHGGDLPGLIDVLFLRVCDILDMRLYSFHGTIKVCRDFKQLNAVYNNLFDKNLTNRYSFYVYNLNTIYVSAEHFTRDILGHEMAHAVISHYFVVLPSIKVQEVLATYVEYTLRKFEAE